MIKIEHNFSSLLDSMTELQKRRLPVAIARAIDATAKKIKKAEQKEMRDVFDRVTPYIHNSVFMQSTRGGNLTATVGIKDQAVKSIAPSKILSSEITGGERRLKRYEKALMLAGALPPGYVTVPGKGVTLDAYGNISRGLIVQLLSYFRAFPEAGHRANSTESSRAKLKRGTKTKMGVSYFVGRPGGGKLPFGIWQRIHSGFGTGLKPILIFVPSALYEAILDFKFVAEITIKKEYGNEFNRAFSDVARLTN